MTQRITKKQIDNMVNTLKDSTGATLGYSRSYENQYQLYLQGSESGRIERTLGRVIQGNSNFYDTLYTAVDLIRVRNQSKSRGTEQQ